MTTRTLTPEKWVEREAAKWVKQRVADFREIQAEHGTGAALQMMHILLSSFIYERVVEPYPGVPVLKPSSDTSSDDDDWVSGELDAGINPR